MIKARSFPALKRLSLMSSSFVRWMGRRRSLGRLSAVKDDDQLPEPCHMRQRDLFFCVPTSRQSITLSSARIAFASIAAPHCPVSQ